MGYPYDITFLGLKAKLPSAIKVELTHPKLEQPIELELSGVWYQDKPGESLTFSTSTEAVCERLEQLGIDVDEIEELFNF